MGIGLAGFAALIAGWKWLSVSFRSVRSEDGLASGSREAGNTAVPDPQLALFPPEDEAIFFAIADAIVPRFEGSPPASEVALLPHMLSWIALFPNRIELYHEVWPRLRAAVVAKAQRPHGTLDSAALNQLLENWFSEIRTSHSPHPEARLFEAIRRHVLRAYYATPEGQSFAGYSLPEHPPKGAHQSVSMCSEPLS